MYDIKTSIIIIVILVSSIITLLRFIEGCWIYLYKKNKESVVAEIRRVESDRNEFALLIKSLQRQIVLLSDHLDRTEKDRKEKIKEIEALEKKLKSLENTHE